jgi:argininosuccinate synthase
LIKRAKKSGANKIYIKDLRKEFAYKYILPSLKADACYQGKYLLATALGRPLIAYYLVALARKEKARYVAHGCTGKGNDQVRFEVTINMLEPALRVIAPLREWDLTSREEEINYAKKNKLPIKTTKENPYSIDKNIWGTSIEAGILEELEKEPPPHSYIDCLPPKRAQDKEIYIELAFERGIPKKLNNKNLDLVQLIEKLNTIGALCGIGRTDLIEDRMVGIKSREVYEAPAAWILYSAHKELEHLTLDRETLFLKEQLALKYAQLIYQGLWFSQIKTSLDHFIEATQKSVSGSVGLKVYKGNITVVKRAAKRSLYKKELATYGKGDKFNRKLAEGFIKLWGMPYVGSKRSP